MQKLVLSLGLVLSTGLNFRADELRLEHSQASLQGTERRFESAQTGEGDPAQWQLVESAIKSEQPAIGQLSENAEADRRAMLLYADRSFDDFEWTASVRLLEGSKAQTAGIVFRWQDELNYYSARLDASGGWLVFRKVVNGEEQEPIGNRYPVQTGKWYTLNVVCSGPQITLRLDSETPLPALTDTQFNSGKIGYWTGADTTAHFRDPIVKYRPKVILAQRLVDRAMAHFNRLLGISLYARPRPGEHPTVIASHDEKNLGKAGDEAVLDVIVRRKIYFAKQEKSLFVTLPLRDRNGEGIAACRIELKSRFFAADRQSAIARCQPVVKLMQAEVLNWSDLFQ